MTGFAPMMATGFPAVEVPLPDEEVSAEDIAPFGDPVPEMLVNEPPVVPERAPQGMAFDWAALDFESQEQFDAKPPEHRQLIYEMEVLGNRYSQEQAAKRILEIQRDLATLNNPKAQIAAEKARMETQQMSQEMKAKQSEAEQSRARVAQILETMDRYEPELDALVGPGAGLLQAKDLVTNPDRYAARKELEMLTKFEVLDAAKFVKPLSNDELKFLKEMFPDKGEPPQVWRNYFARTRRILGKGLEDQPAPQGEAANKSNMGAATPASPVQQATPAPSGRIEDKPAEVTIRGRKFIRNERGNYVPAE
jgi:hypothetical protein